ncbi:PAS domain S-box protein [Candidatus Acetothermia bacterium]|nr:PAS domain S-box protein [Candidatus Acetothermia bacterium]MCI2431946.1 PAS domain S-box protein [Candidatus Acetothermia bacterium]MCI2436627.1 PAS domain S-box protein [Candidatus Acetothermia bacterium]
MPLIAPIAFGYILSVMSSSTSFWSRHRSRIIGSLGLIINLVYLAKDYLDHGPNLIPHLTQAISRDVWLYTGLFLLIPLFMVLGITLHRVERERDRFQTLFEAAQDGVYLREADGTMKFVNQKFLEIHGLQLEDVLGRRSLELLALTAQERQRLTLEMRQALLKSEPPPMSEAPFRRPDGTLGWLQINVAFLKEEGQVKEVLGIVRDITERKRIEDALRGQNRVLELLSQETPLSQILTTICQSVEAQIEGVLGSILLLDGEKLRHGAAPSLPEGYNQAVDGLTIGPTVGSCGTAASLKKQVIVSDTFTDPLWESYRDLVKRYSLRACWSTPIIAQDGIVLGTFAMYHRQPRSPSSYELRVVEQSAHLARLALERQRARSALRRREEILHAVTHVAECLLTANTWEECASEVLQYLGRATQVSRVYLFENHLNEREELLTSQRFEWAALGIPPQIDNPDLQNLNYAANGFARWVEVLEQHQPLQGLIRDFPESEQAVLALQEIKSILCVPIFVGDRWWGFIGFDECVNERLWSEAEIDALKAAANIVGIAIERKQTEAQLRTSETRYRSLFEGIPIGLYRSTPDGRVLDANRALIEMLGYPTKEALLAISAPMFFLDPKERRRWQTEMDAKGIVNDFITQLKRYDGTPIWVRDSARTICAESGHVLYYDGSLEEITERKHAEEALKRSQEHLRTSEERYRDLVEHANDAIYTIDNYGRFTSFNRKAEEITGYKLDEVLGRPYTILVQGRERHKTRRAFVRNLRGEVNTTEVAVARKDGTSAVLELSSRPIWREGRVVGIQGIARDITERKNLEQLQQEFVSTVSHELRTPLTSIKGYVDLILGGDTGPLTPEQEEFLRIVSQNTTRLTHLINDLLDIQKLEAGRIEFEFDQIALEELLQEITQAMRLQAEQKGLSFRTELESSLLVRGDRERLAQVFNNLLSNAIKYTLEGEIVLTARRREGAVMVSVSDTGIGLSEKDLQKLFQKFYRSENPHVRKAGGTGLGLAITKAILDRHNGKIEVVSQPNKGSTFSVWLPALIHSTSSAPRPTVLVIEDELEIAKLISKYIQKLGYQTEMALTAQEGLEKALKLKPQLITLDVLMPDMDGFTLIQRLKDHPQTAPIPVIFLSIVQDRLHGLRLGASAYLTKPIDERKFSETVRNLLEPRGQPVLVADDDPDFAGLLQRMLQREGWSAEVAYNGEEALEKLRSKPYQLVLLDKNMPKRSGLEVLQELRNHKALAHIPVIVISGTGRTEKLAQSVQVLGAKKFLSKKLSPQTLVQEIVEFLESL